MTLRWWIALTAVAVVDGACSVLPPPSMVTVGMDGDFPNWSQIKKNFDHLTSKFADKKLTFHAVPSTETSYVPSNVQGHFIRARSAFTYPFAVPENPLFSPPIKGATVADKDQINANFDNLVRELEGYQVIQTTALTESDPTLISAAEWTDVQDKFNNMKRKFAQKGLNLVGLLPDVTNKIQAKTNFDTVAAVFTPGLKLADVASGGVGAADVKERKQFINDNFRKIKKAYDDYSEVLSFSPQEEFDNLPVDWLKVRHNFDQLTRVLPVKGMALAAVPRCAAAAVCPPLNPTSAQQFFDRVAKAFKPQLHLAPVDIGGSTAAALQPRKQSINANFQKIKSAWDAFKASRSYYEWTWYQDEIGADDDVCDEEE